MGSTKRRWVWLAIVAVAVVAWWLFPRAPTSAPSASPAPAAVSEPPSAERRPTPAEIPTEPVGTDEQEPIAAPLPRHEVELPEPPSSMDGGVEDPVPVEQRRDEMLGTVLDRLNEDLRAAEEAGDDEEAARLKIRIERLRQRRDELAEP